MIKSQIIVWVLIIGILFPLLLKLLLSDSKFTEGEDYKNMKIKTKVIAYKPSKWFYPHLIWYKIEYHYPDVLHSRWKTIKKCKVYKDSYDWGIFSFENKIDAINFCKQIEENPDVLHEHWEREFQLREECREKGMTSL